MENFVGTLGSSVRRESATLQGCGVRGMGRSPGTALRLYPVNRGGRPSGADVIWNLEFRLALA